MIAHATIIGMDDIGFMTRREYLVFRNPQDKFHSSNIWNYDIEKMNNTLRGAGSTRTRDNKEYEFYQNNDMSPNFIIILDRKVVGVIYDGTLYYLKNNNPKKIPTYFHYRNENIEIPVHTYTITKYFDALIEKIKDVRNYNLTKYPFIIQRLGELEIRSEKEPQISKNEIFVILNEKKERIAFASNEWGATLIAVAEEYQGRGLGVVLGNLWYAWNPTHISGGYSPQGEANAIRIWEHRVRELMADGTYTAMIRAKKITATRVKEIIATLPERRKPKPESPKQEPSLLLRVEDFGFVLYDAAFLKEQDEKYIYAYGFFRSSENIGNFLFRLEYEPPHKKMATYVALQMARNDGEKIYIGEGYGDYLELEGIRHIAQNGDYVELTQDVIDLRDIGRREAALRRKLDQYGEIGMSMLELADAKWQ